MTMHEMLMAQFPIRRTKEEKQRFRTWAVQQMRQAGWEARVEETSKGGHQNVVIGDPDSAAVIFSAHYDTPADMIAPNLMMPCNIPAHLAYQAAFIIVLLCLGLLAGAAVGAMTQQPRLGSFAFIAAYFGILLFLNYGRSNQNNANDNTSGVAAVLQLAQRIPQEQRSKCAFILFDNEERGKQGSKFYARDHLQQQYMTLLINLDCVGNGDHMLFICKDMARKCTGFGTLERTIQPTAAITPHILNSRFTIVNSDQTNFKCGIAVMACRRLPIIGYLTGRIHTSRDTQYSSENLDYLTDTFTAWLDALSRGV